MSNPPPPLLDSEFKADTKPSLDTILHDRDGGPLKQLTNRFNVQQEMDTPLQSNLINLIGSSIVPET